MAVRKVESTVAEHLTMPELEFKYELSYRPLISETNGGNTLTQPLPVIEVALTYKGITVSDLALIDSGSTYSLFSRDVADQLGIEVLNGDMRKLTTLGGPLIAYSHTIGIEVVPNLRYEAVILFSEYPIPPTYSAILASLSMLPSHCEVSSA